jgi:hypothetical protein
VAFLLALLVANPACCCFGKWLTQLTLDEPVPASCCADPEGGENSAAQQDDKDCVCKTTQVTQAQPWIEQTSLFASSLVVKVPVEILSVAAFAPRSVAGSLSLDAPPRTKIPTRLAHQVFLL